jgi:hypothetical protein
MSEITLEKIHALLERLAGYTMSDLPTRKEMVEKLDQKADQKDVDEIKQDLQIIINGMDKQVKQLDIIRTEQVAFNQAFNRLEKRVEKLEQTS